jgi:hypothetical protein
LFLLDWKRSNPRLGCFLQMFAPWAISHLLHWDPTCIKSKMPIITRRSVQECGRSNLPNASSSSELDCYPRERFGSTVGEEHHFRHGK